MQSLQELDEEHSHFRKVLASFMTYGKISLLSLKKYFIDYGNLKPWQKELLPAYLPKLDSVAKCIQKNQLFLQEIVREHCIFKENNGQEKQCDSSTPPLDLSFIRSTLRQFVREWSQEGKTERESCYEPILSTLANYFPENSRVEISVLVPGAGLGRLAFEIAALGFRTQGNENSFYMLLASEFLLNRVVNAYQFEIFPYALNFANVRKVQDQIRSILVPDKVPMNSNVRDFSMTAGDFLEIYGKQQESWNVVVTCFFLDTASNVVEYMQLVHQILKKGAMWINLGPLLYHFGEVPEKVSIELAGDELIEVIYKSGFKIIRY